MPEVAYVSIKEAAQLLGISRQRVQELIRDGKLPANRLAGSTVWLVREADVIKRLQQRIAASS
jgi:excisionase family DNA binding protein